MEAWSENDLPAIAASKTSTPDKALKALQDTTPLYELLDPLFRKLTTGLANMTRIVGTATPPKDITPDLLAVGALVKERCDNGVILPVMEMNEIVSAHRETLDIMYDNQVAQLTALKGNVKKMRENMAVIREKAEIANANAKSLAQRSASVLQSAYDLLPTITQAEYDYFQELKKLDQKTIGWQQEFERLKLKLHTLQDSIDEGTINGSLQLTSDCLQRANMLLLACGTLIKKQTARLKEASDNIDDLAAVAGLDLTPDNPLPTIQ